MDVESEQPAILVVDEEGEIHQWEDDLGASKPTTNRKKRRSSVAIARRMSRASGVGPISLEEQLALIPTAQEADPAERLRQVVNICVRNTCRTVEREELDNDGDLLDEVRSLNRYLMDNPIVEPDVLDKVANSLVSGKLKVDVKDLIPPRVRAVREYTAKLEEESKQWKKVQMDRYKFYKSEIEATKSGNDKVDDSRFYSLTADEKKYFRSLPDLKKLRSTVVEHQKRQAVADAELLIQAKRLKAKLDDVDMELVEAAHDLMQQAEPGRAVGVDAQLDPRDLLKDEEN